MTPIIQNFAPRRREAVRLVVNKRGVALMSHIAAFIGRIMLAVLFIVSGFGKLMDLSTTEDMITGAGLPSGLALPLALFEILGGIALVAGIMTRFAAILLAAFTLLAALFFHNRLTDPMQQVHALKNLAIAGGLLCLFAHSQMRWSYDSMRLRRRAELAETEAAAKVHDAELRASRAEGRAEVRADERVVPVRTLDTDETVRARPVDTLTTPPRRRRRWF